MKFLLQSCLILISISTAFLKLAPRTKIHVKHRIDDCTRRSKKGDILFVHYKGYLDDGSLFDSSHTSGVPYRFILGSNQVIQGWDDGLKGMCVGEIRRLIVPPKFAYGEAGSGHLIPPNAELHFEVELMKIHERIEL